MTRIIKLTDIIVAEGRQRQEFDPTAMQELEDSIRERGLMHAPVLRDGIAGTYVLVAGERRIKAISNLHELQIEVRYNGLPVPHGCIPYTSLGELDELEAEECELDENLKRKDLTWQEHAAAIKRLNTLRQKQAEKAGKPAHTVADTAKEVYGRSDGYFGDAVRKELIVAQHLDNPMVVKAKNVDEAFKILKREEDAKRNIALAAAIGDTFSASSHTLLNVDCLEWMSRTENHSRFDVILTDPPYGMGAHEFGDAGGKMAGITHSYDDSHESWQLLLGAWCKLAYVCAKPQAHAYVFCDIDRFHELKSFMQTAGWYVFRTPFVVHKIDSGRVPLPDRGPRRQYEIILYAIKGDKPVTNIFPDVIPCSGDNNLGHGAQKPVALYQNLLQRSVKPGDEVLDSFAGSGTIFPAAHLFKVRATGLEKNPEYFGMASERLKELDNAK